MIRAIAASALAWLLSACASLPVPPGLSTDGEPVELDATPFFAQRQYQCGPAALATSLGASGVEVEAEALVGEVYLPARKGSLQAEIIASARRHGRVAAPVRGEPAALVAELRAGAPVLVLLNLGRSWLPIWHYAVVVGYEPAGGRFVLRSGTERRAQMAAAVFERAWSYSGHWGVVVTRPDAIPATTSMRDWLAAVAPLESLGRLAEAADAYRAATQRWPAAALAWAALGNAEARREHWDDAIAAYARSLHEEDAVATRNNRADALIHLGCARLAADDLAKAAALDDGRYAAVIERTRAGLPAVDTCPAAIAERVAAP